MGTKNINKEQLSQLTGKLELIIHAVQPGTVISEEMAEMVIETLMETREVIKEHPHQI